RRVVLLYFSKPVPSVICLLIVVLGCIRCAYRSDRGLLQRFPNTEMVAQAARRFAPIIRHPDNQTYWPVDVGNYLNFDDGTLRSRYYDQTGEQPLAGNLFSIMFENPSVWAALNLPRKPFETHIPFVATVGIDGGVPPFPISPLTAGHLNLPAADARLIPGRLQPTVFAEIKSLAATVQTNYHYALTAAGGGRFSPLRHNRIHTDPLLRRLTDVSARATLASIRGARTARFVDPIMLVFHGFYPADDGTRRRNDGTGTNREFHHLAVGLLFTESVGHLALVARGRNLLFISSSPTEATVIPLDHSSLRFLDDSGQENPEGSHPIIFANTLGIQGYGSKGEADKSPLKDTAKGGLNYNPDDGEWWIGLGAAVGLGALAGAPAGPVGAAIGAAVGLVVYLLAWLLKKLFGGKKDRQKEWTEQEPWPGETSKQSFQQSANNDIGPSGTTSETGGAKPGRSYALKVIPHVPENNLYGLAFAGGDNFRIIEDVNNKEILAWLAFEGGVGYQFDRPLPGRAESAGTSMQNYFELFLHKFIELEKAEAEVVYFEA
ncbi:MAG: glycine zipper family protein, partial [Actinomycetota bacterium]